MNIIKSVFSVVLMVVTMSATASVFGQNPTCSVRVSFWNIAVKSGSSWHPVGEFPMKFEGGYEDSILRNFRHSDSNSDVIVKVARVESGSKGVAEKLKLAISLSPNANDVFEDVDRSEAQAPYDKSWTWLQVTKGKKVGDRIYYFDFGCSKSSTADLIKRPSKG